MYAISKDFAFAASHRLDGLPAAHPCSRLHGHNYTVRITVKASSLDPVGFVLDYHDLTPFGQWLDDNLDHRHLNDVLSGNPTAENLARHLATIATSLIPAHQAEIGVSETPKTWAWWTP